MARDDSPALMRCRLTICGIDELPEHAEAGVTHTLSILDPETPLPRGFSAYREIRDHWVLRFHDVTRAFAGARPPEAEDVEAILSCGEEIRHAGKNAHLLIHCHAGVSRSAAAAAILLAQHFPGREREALENVIRLRPIAAPNSRMIHLADRLLERNGAFVEALEDLFRARRGGRGESSWLGMLLRGSGDPFLR